MIDDPRTGLWLEVLNGEGGGRARRCSMCSSWLVEVVATRGAARASTTNPEGVYCMGTLFGDTPCPMSLKALGPMKLLRALLK